MKWIKDFNKLFAETPGLIPNILPEIDIGIVSQYKYM